MRARWLTCVALTLAFTQGCGRKSAQPATSMPVASPTGLTIRFLDVGQGDAALMQWHGHAVLIDGGTPEVSATLLGDLRGAGVKNLDCVIATHPHADHIGGLPAVLRAIPVARFVDSGFQEGSPQQVDLLTTIRDRKIPFQVAHQGETLDLGDGLSLHMLSPPKPVLTGTESDANNNSVVARADYGGVRILLTGDMEGAERKRVYAWLRTQPSALSNLRADILKCAHHGSRNGTDARFLRAVRPRYAVISCADGNSYGHPHTAALRVLKDAGVDLYRTDKQGNITFTIEGTAINVTTARTAVGDIWAAGDRQGGQARTGHARRRRSRATLRL